VVTDLVFGSVTVISCSLLSFTSWSFHLAIVTPTSATGAAFNGHQLLFSLVIENKMAPLNKEERDLEQISPGKGRLVFAGIQYYLPLLWYLRNLRCSGRLSNPTTLSRSISCFLHSPFSSLYLLSARVTDMEPK
jgi:hypothetical protein